MPACGRVVPLKSKVKTRAAKPSGPSTKPKQQKDKPNTTGKPGSKGKCNTKAKPGSKANAERLALNTERLALALGALWRGRLERRRLEACRRSGVQRTFDASRDVVIAVAAARAALWNAVEDCDLGATRRALDTLDALGGTAAADALASRNREGENVLFEAAGTGELAILQQLLVHPAVQPHLHESTSASQGTCAARALDNRGRTAAFRACCNGHEGTVRALQSFIGGDAAPQSDRVSAETGAAVDDSSATTLGPVSAAVPDPPIVSDARALVVLRDLDGQAPCDVAPQGLAQLVGLGTVGGHEPPPTSVGVEDVVESRAALQRLLAAAAALDAAAVRMLLPNVTNVNGRCVDQDVGTRPSALGAIGEPTVHSSTCATPLCAVCAAARASCLHQRASSTGAAEIGAAVDIVAQLLERGADVNAPTADGSTPLALAVQGGTLATPVVEALLHAGATPWLKDGEGHDATARASHNPGLISLLQAADGWAGLRTSGVPAARAGSSDSSATLAHASIIGTSTSFNPFAPRQAGLEQTLQLKAMSAEELRAGGAKYQRLIEERELASFGYS
eukprot:g699.t1